MRKLIYFVATSLDGFIAAVDGSLNGFEWSDSFVDEIKRNYPETIPTHLYGKGEKVPQNLFFDVVLMGRNTYEVCLNVGITNPYGTLQQYVFSRTMTESPDSRVQLIRDKAEESVSELKRQSGRAIWICGGANLATSLLSAKLIDEIIIKLNPALFGTGIPLFHPQNNPISLSLEASKAYSSGHTILHYSIK